MLASRLHWRLLVATVLGLVAAAWIAPILIKAPDVQENRILAVAPAWPTRLRDLLTIRKPVDQYVADHFPPRRHLIGVLNRLRMMARVSGSKRVIVGRDGWLFYDDETHLGAARNAPALAGPEIRQWLLTLAGRDAFVRARGAHYLVLTPAAKEVIYPQHGPAWYRGPSPDRPALALPKLAQQSGAGEVLYLYPQIAAATAAGRATFSRHDTHWTGYGAYAGYAGLMTRLHALGLTAEGPKPLSAFRPVDFPPERGPRDLALMLGVSSLVRLSFPHIEDRAGGVLFTTAYLGSKTDWTAPQVIDTGVAGKPVLLMTRDSFSNELMPFLYPHFSRIVLAHNQDGFWRPDLIERFKPDIVVLEVIEAGLRVSQGDGPPPSPEATAHIDRVLAGAKLDGGPAATPVMPSMTPPDARTAAILASAVPSANCNVEVATLTPGPDKAATLTISGWFSELGARVTAPQGLIVLKGEGATLAASVTMDKKRPDVAAYFKNPTGADSGFVATLFINAIPKGVYSPRLFRRSGDAWIVCAGKQTFAVP